MGKYKRFKFTQISSGFYDVPWHNPLIKAPVLKQLAKKGVTLEQNYALPVCSPSRAALMSGVYPHTSGMMVSCAFIPYWSPCFDLFRLYRL